jgi:hypothetical protein
MKKQLQRLGNKLKAPEFNKLTHELKARGEFGRAVPGINQTQIRAESASKVPIGLPDIPAATGRTEISTYFTKPGGDFLLYQAESWVRLRLMLETAGPVAVGSRDQVSPVLSGKGILLPRDVEITFPLSKGNRIFITAGAVNRVRFIIEPIPWADQVGTMIGSIVSLLRKG